MRTFTKSLNDFASQVAQIGLFSALWLVVDRIDHFVHCTVPTSVISMFVMVGLLLAHVLSTQHIEAGARRLLADLPLFFIPPLLSITEAGAVFAHYGFSLLAALAIGSIVVMACTGLIVDRVFRFEAQIRTSTSRKCES